MNSQVFSPLDQPTNPPEDTLIESAIPACQVSHEELFQIKNMSRSWVNFAVQLLKQFFEPSELEGKNIAGVQG